MRSSICAQSCASVPPAPAWIVIIALLLSCGPENTNKRSFSASSWVMRSSPFSTSCNASSSCSSDASVSSSVSSRRVVSSLAIKETSRSFSASSWVIPAAFSRSFQNAASCWSVVISCIRCFLLAMSKTVGYFLYPP